MSAPRRGLAVTRAALAALVVLAAARARAIPTLPDPRHDAAATPWSSVPIPMLNPFTDEHQHFDTSDLAGVANAFKTYAVWDDRIFRYNAALDRSLSKALDKQDYGHGFMAIAATYCFDKSFFPPPGGLPLPKVPGPFPNWAMPLVTLAEQTWEIRVNNVFNAANVNGVPIATQLAFKAAKANCDIHVRFDTEYPRAGKQVPFPDDSFDDQGHYNGKGANPGNGIDGVLAYWSPSTRELVFNSYIDWFQLANIKAPNAGPNQFDFQTVAVHEWGHVIGLEHPPGAAPRVDSVMTPALGKRALGGPPAPPAAARAFGINHVIDPGSFVGASALYSIAKVPPPNDSRTSLAPSRPWMICLHGGGAIEVYHEPSQGLVGLTLGRAVTPNRRGFVVFTPEVMARSLSTTVLLPVGFQYDFALPVRGLAVYPRATIGYAVNIATFDVGPFNVDATTHLGVFTLAAGLTYTLRDRWIFGVEPLGFTVFFNADAASVVYRIAAVVGVRL
jgi:Matrixin